MRPDSLRRATILLVDDTPALLSLYARVLESHVTLVLTATSGMDALDVLKHKRPDVVVSDIAMPGLDGLELISAIRRSEVFDGERLPALAISAFGNSFESRALESGFDAFMAKPIDLGRFLAVVGDLSTCDVHAMRVKTLARLTALVGYR